MPRTLIAAALALVLPALGMASEEDDSTSLSYISYLERYATVQPASQEDSLEAVINMPLMSGDRIDTAREGRLEAILSDGSYLWLDEYTTASLDAVAFSRDTRGDRTVIYLADGVMMIELMPDVLRPNPTRIDSAEQTIHLDGPGVYRVEVLPSGGLWVEVWEGLAEAATPAGMVDIRAGTAAEVGGAEVSAVQAQLTDRDDFARWVQARRTPAGSESAQYVDGRYSREAGQLDSYGSWVYLESGNTWAWQPSVASDWRPYTAGRWYWSTTGWCWLSYEPWGWLPYHYGSWWNSPGHGWVWCWGRTWSPAWVYWAHWPGYVGWCPVGYYSSWWWGCGWGWGGYYPGHGGGGYYPPPGGGGGRPPRGDVVPPGGGADSARIRQDRPAAASDLVLDMEGRTRTSALDGRGWSAVPERDFASPHVGRIVRPADDALRSTPDRQATITSRPLITESPGRAAPSSELPRVFREVEGRAGTDLSRVVAREPGLSREEALDAVVPRSAGSMTAPARGSAEQVTGGRADTGAQGGQAGGSLPSDHEIGFDGRTGASRPESNYYRSSLSLGGTRFDSGLGRYSAGGGNSASRGGRSGGGSTTMPPTGDRSSASSGSRSVNGGRAQPSRPGGRSWTTTPSSGREPSGRSSSGYSSRSAPSGRSPVVVPRSTPSGRAGSSRSGIVPRSSSRPSGGSYRGAPSSSGSSRSAPRSYGSSSRSRSSSSSSAPRASSSSSSSGSSGRSSASSSSSSSSTSSSARRR